jgi:hypothetical protein
MTSALESWKKGVWQMCGDIKKTGTKSGTEIKGKALNWSQLVWLCHHFWLGSRDCRMDYRNQDKKNVWHLHQGA